MKRIPSFPLTALLLTSSLTGARAQPSVPPPLRGSLAYSAGNALVVRDLENGKIVEIPAQEIGETHDNTGGVQPLAFSPDGRRLAVRVWKGGNRIYVLEENLREAHWVTRGLLTETNGGTTYYWDHLDVAWSPDGRRLAVSSARAGEARVSAWDGESLRTLHKSTPPEHATDPYRMSWSADGETLYVVPPRGPEPHELIAVPFSKGEAVLLHRGPEKNPFTALAWDPARKTLAVAAGTSLVLSGETGSKETWKSPAHLRAVSWSPDGRRLAGIDWNGGIYVVGRDGGDAWAVTGSTEDKWFAPNVAWIGPAKFAFVLVTRAGGAGLYIADAETRSVTRLPVADVVATDLTPVPGRTAFTFLRVSDRGEWKVEPRSEREFRTRSVHAALQVYDASDGSVVPVPAAAALPGEETEGDFAVYLYLLLHLR